MAKVDVINEPKYSTYDLAFRKNVLLIQIRTIFFFFLLLITKSIKIEAMYKESQSQATEYKFVIRKYYFVQLLPIMTMTYRYSYSRYVFNDH